MENLQKIVQRIPYAPHSVFPNVNVLYTHSVTIETRKLTLIDYY